MPIAPTSCSMESAWPVSESDTSQVLVTCLWVGHYPAFRQIFHLFLKASCPQGGLGLRLVLRLILILSVT